MTPEPKDAALPATTVSLTAALVLGIAMVGPSMLGCGKKNPVQEISVRQSGIEVADSEWGYQAFIEQQDWNAWRGPRNDGVVVNQTLPTTWNDDTNVRWRTDVEGRGHGSPIVVGSSVYVATARKGQQQQCVVALDRESGAEQWVTVIHQGGFPSDREIHAKGTNANGTLASDGSRLFTAMFNSDAIIATCLDLKGEIVWQREIGKFVSRFGYAPSPILYRSLVIFAADNLGGGYLAALDRESGEIAWRVARENLSSYSSPVIAQVGGRDQLLISGCESVTSYDPATGEQYWQTACTTESTCGTIVTNGELLLAAGGYPDNGTVCLSAEGEVVWSNRTRLYEPSMIISGDYVVSCNDDGIAFCWSIGDGQLKWKRRLGGNFSASPIISEGNIYVSNLSGETFIFRAGEQYEAIAKNRLGDDCYASPAASRGELFFRIGVGRGEERREQVVCISAPSEEES